MDIIDPSEGLNDLNKKIRPSNNLKDENCEYPIRYFCRVISIACELFKENVNE